MAKQKHWKNRIVENGVLAADQYNPHELNARVHPEAQRAALVGSLNTVGWVAPVVISAKSGKILDGHARVEEALARDPNQPVPFVKVNVTAQEEATILATFDPIGAMAEYEKATLDSLLREVETGEAALQSLLADLAKQQGLYQEEKTTLSSNGNSNKLPVVARVQAGDQWQLGDHRLFIGDTAIADGEMIVRRWETETGLEAKLLERNNGENAKPKAQKANAKGQAKASAGGKAK